MIGEKIKDLRIDKNLTQEDLAIKLYISRQTISRWENGKTIPTMENLMQLSHFFSVPIDYFSVFNNTEKIIYNKLHYKNIIKNKHMIMLLYLFFAIIPFFSIWTIPLAIYSFIYSKKRKVQHYPLVRLVALTSLSFFIIQLLIFLVGLFNLNSSTTEILID